MRLLDLLYPPICVNCCRVDTILCDECYQLIDFSPQQYSPLSNSVIARHVAVGPHTGVLRQAIHVLKYENDTRIGPVLGEMLDNVLWNSDVDFDLIIPVPLHKARQRKRGYNQSRFIAQGVSGGHVIEDVLIRHRYTTSQTELSSRERQINVQGAFRAHPELSGHRVLLVDDVCTTGSTLLACAQALVDVGVDRIYAATVSYAN